MRQLMLLLGAFAVAPSIVRRYRHGVLLSEETVGTTMFNTYDTEGRRTLLSTTRDGTIWDVTTWEYDPATGRCTAKRYADGSSITYTYTANNLNQYTSILRSSAPPREISHDLDGNMLSDGNLSFAYDAANRLKAVSSNGVLLVTNFYDAKSRRVKKVTPEATTTFFYDDWNLIEERVAYTNGTSSTILYVRGKDISDTLQGAGGIGGLLYLTVSNSSSQRQLYVPCYDNNGNITRCFDADGNTVAQYTYDAFGNIVAQSGPLADFFHVRFSTKYFDPESGLYYYGYRFYSPALMRWLNRDPIGEDGGLNLHGFCGNNAIVGIDVFGLYELTLISDWTVESDVLMWYLHGNVGNVIRTNIHSPSQLLAEIRRENLRHGSMVTVLNISGHGLQFGSGVSFANKSEFDVGKSYNDLKLLLARNATIRIWSCDAASTYKKCSNLKTAADALDAVIYANTGSVMAGPDGDALSRMSQRVVAWVIGTTQGEWRRFTPRPKIKSRGLYPGPRAFKISKSERKIND